MGFLAGQGSASDSAANVRDVIMPDGNLQADVCIVGSGAAGGIAAKVLTDEGFTVIMLEAGGVPNSDTDFKQHVWPYELVRRGYAPGARKLEWAAPEASFDFSDEPYTCTSGSQFMWYRARIVGGRTNQWGGGAYRFSDHNFRGRTLDGAGEDWPVDYAELAPFYDRVEDLIGVFGEDTALPPPPPRCTELLVKMGCDKLGIPCRPARAAILTRPWRGRPACHYCGQCNRGCRTASNFSSSQVLIPEALASRKLRLIPFAMVRELVADSNGVRSAIYVDKISRTEHRVRAKAFVLAASACESARLLLNSRSAGFPNGLANTSGVVGRNLTDSVGSAAMGYFPQLRQLSPHNHDGTGGMHLHIPSWQSARKTDFIRGYSIEFGGGPRMPNVCEFHRTCDRFQGYGVPLKQHCRDIYGTMVCFSGMGEMIPNDASYCEIDPSVVDTWGIPVLRFHFQWGDNELAMAKDMQATLREIIEASGGIYLEDDVYPISVGGEYFHELGTVRMGTNPRNSALNSFCQAHDATNLFVVDGACFSSGSETLPTLTIMALAWRAADHLASEAGKGNL